METFLAFNFDVTDKPLNLSDLIHEPPESVVPNSSVRSRFGAFKDWARSFFVRRDGSPEAAILKSLETNRPASPAPIALEFIDFLWVRVLKFVAVAVAICLCVYWWKGAPAAIGAGIISAILLVYLVWQSQSALGANTALERRICIGSTGLAILLAAKGATGFLLKGRVSENEPWYTVFEFGESDHQFLWAGVACFAIGHLIVYGIQRNKVMHAGGTGS